MKALIQHAIFIFLLAGFSNCTDKNPNIQYDKKYFDEIKIARSEIFLFMSQNSIPGGTFAIAKEGKIIYSEGLGTASKELKTPVTRGTKFRIGSLSELLTSATYRKLVEEGIVHPDSSVQVYYPEFPKKKYNITLQQLADHTSGLREATLEEQDKKELNPTVLRGIEDFKNDTLLIAPGVMQIPTLFSYNLLGAVMEKATQETFPDLLKIYITDTLGLNNTLTDNPLITIEGRSDFYTQDFMFQVLNAFTRDMRYKAPSEGVLSNAEDLVKFGNAILHSDYFSEEFKKALFEPVRMKHDRVSNMTHGWMLIKDREERDIYGRSGKVPGGTAALVIYPEEQIVVAFAINLEVSTNDFPVFRMAGCFLPQTEEVEKNEETE